MRRILHILMLLTAFAPGSMMTLKAQNYHFKGDCFDVQVYDIYVNGQQADTLHVAPGIPLQLNFTARLDPDACVDWDPTSILIGYNVDSENQYGFCLWANQESSLGGSHYTVHNALMMPGPSRPGTYYFRFAKSQDYLVKNTGSMSYGRYISSNYNKDSTIIILKVQEPVLPSQPWHVSGTSLYYTAGSVGIGTSTPSSSYALSVNGNIRTKKVVVETGWADHVLAPGYALPTLDSVRAHIDAHGHLPGIPSEAEILAQGLDVGDVQRAMMAKIEELTLYLMEMQGENARLRSRVEVLEGTLENSEGGLEK